MEQRMSRVFFLSLVGVLTWTQLAEGRTPGALLSSSVTEVAERPPRALSSTLPADEALDSDSEWERRALIETSVASFSNSWAICTLLPHWSSSLEKKERKEERKPRMAWQDHFLLAQLVYFFFVRSDMNQRLVAWSMAMAASSWLDPAEGSFIVMPSLSYNVWAPSTGETDPPVELSNDPSGGVALNGTGVWTLQKVRAFYAFVEIRSGKCLDAVTRAIGGQVVLSECTEGVTQLWSAISTQASDLSVQWMNVGTGLCLDAIDGAASSPLLLWTCRRGAHSLMNTQLWLPLPPSVATRESSASGLSLNASSSAPDTYLNAFSRHASWAAADLPESVDWRPLLAGAKDQSSCGSCHVFAAVATIEGAYNILAGPPSPASLSEQAVLDCGPRGACAGGWPADVLSWLAARPADAGLPATSAYGSYVGQPRACKEAVPGAVRVVRFEEVPALSPRALRAAVSRQPVLAYVTLTEELQLWNSWDIFKDSQKACGVGAMLTHVVAVVGYGTEGGTEYWIVRNSFGRYWGDYGAARVMAGVCGLQALPALYPVLAPPDRNPCGAINPCGAGTCIRGESLSYNCSCPPGYLPVVNTDGTQTCAPEDACGTATGAWNPCGAGTCVNSGDALYHCVCFAGYAAALNARRQQICVPPAQTVQALESYTAEAGDDCYLIAAAYGLTVQQLTDMNPRSERDVCSPLLVGDVLNVTNAEPYDCKVLYSIQKNDSCSGIESKFSLPPSSLSAVLNPAVNCSGDSTLTPGQQVCIVSGQPDATKVCTASDRVTSSDVASGGCDQMLLRNTQINITTFYEMNRGINCQNLFVGQELCVGYQQQPPDTCAKYYVWQRGDTCYSVIALFCGTRSNKRWPECFPGSEVCVGTGSAWPAGKGFCVPTCFNYLGVRVTRGVANCFG